MAARKTLLTFVVGVGAAVLALGLMPPGAAREPNRKAAGLKMVINGGYDSYVGGQGLTLVGQLPETGVRKIWLERHMGRTGDDWTKVEDLPYRGTTKADGSFAMAIRASDMVNMTYRVRGADGGGATPGVTFNPRTQDVTMDVVNPLGLPIDPLPLVPFFIEADTTPDHVYGRPDLDGLPVFEGRDLTLQLRTGPTEWQDLGTAAVRADGTAIFTTAPQSRASGEYVYRVRMEDWKENGSDIGWQASFPTYVTVGGPLRDRAATAAPLRTAPAAGVPVSLREGPAGDVAASNYQWNPVRWGYDWAEGEDLDSAPKNGPKQGRWIQYTDGAGRVGKDNGQLRLDSGRRLTKDGDGDFGTTRATLSGNADAYGRWETRLRVKTFEAGAKDYDVAIELVPERAQDYQCGRNNITIARYSGASPQMTFGVNAVSTRFTKTIQGPSIMNSIPAFAVELAKDHISWFVDGKVVGVVRGKQYVSDVPMTLRYSLVGDTDTEYKNTSAYSDWQRSFGIESGTQVKRGPKLAKQALASCPE
jgi:hypothetical protein